MATAAGPRPTRALAVILLATVALYLWMFLTGSTSPKLGLDLRGGTSVTLVPRVTEGEQGAITDATIDQAVTIIRNRVNGLGVAEAEVSAQGNGANATIVIAVPGLNQGRIVELVGQTARLTFRPVAQRGSPAPVVTPSISDSPSPSASASPSPSDSASASPTPSPSTSPSPTASPTPSPTGAPTVTITPELQAEYDKLDCTKPLEPGQRPADVAAEPMVTCQRESEEKFILAPVAVEGARINGAEAAIDPTNALAGWVVNLRFDGEGTTQFGTTTADLVDNPSPTNAFAIVLDGVVVSAPVVQSAILDGNAQITGDFTQQEATDLANVLKYGALPLAFETGEIQTISPTLGNDQLRAGIYAGLLGLFLVAVYSLLYYRGLGLVSVFSLLLAALLTFGLLVLLGETIGYTLTLAGIAGAIVAIGITADSFIVYFERVRDEMRDGRSFRVAVETGWVRARRTILAADAVSMIAAVVLYILSVGGVRGFAFTLGLTTIIDVAVVFLFTKPLMTVLARTRFYGEGMRFSGVEARRLHAQPVPSAASTRGRRPAGSPKEA